MFQRLAFLETLRIPLLIAVAGLQSTVYNATEKELKKTKSLLKVL